MNLKNKNNSTENNYYKTSLDFGIQIYGVKPKHQMFALLKHYNQSANGW